MQVTGDGQRVTVQQSRDFALSDTVQCGVVQCSAAQPGSRCHQVPVTIPSLLVQLQHQLQDLGQIDMDIC